MRRKVKNWDKYIDISDRHQNPRWRPFLARCVWGEKDRLIKINFFFIVGVKNLKIEISFINFISMSIMEGSNKYVFGFKRYLWNKSDSSEKQAPPIYKLLWIMQIKYPANSPGCIAIFNLHKQVHSRRLQMCRCADEIVSMHTNAKILMSIYARELGEIVVLYFMLQTTLWKLIFIFCVYKMTAEKKPDRSIHTWEWWGGE